MAFYADIDPRVLYKAEGKVVAVRYAEKHAFLNMTYGLRMEDEQIEYVKGQSAHSAHTAVHSFGGTGGNSHC